MNLRGINVMQEKYLEKIDFYQIFSSVTSYVAISDTVKLLGEQQILKTEEEINQLCFLVKLIKDLIEVYDEYPNFPLESINDSILLLLKENSRLSIEEIKNIIFFLREVLRMVLFLEKSEFEIEILKQLLFVDPSLKSLLEDLCKYIDVDELKIKRGVFKDYDEIDFEIRNLDKKIERQIKQIIDLNSQYLTSTLVYYKSGKYTIALKSSFKNKVKGNVISISSSGETFYVEPNEIVSENNRLGFLSFEKTRIVLKILQKLSDKIRKHVVLLKALYSNFLYYDSLKARAIYGIRSQGLFPKCGSSLNIVNARHPLIQNAKSISFCPSNNRVVVITGPNAGGKTATLKTVALLSAMFQFGIPVPVDESSTFKIFDNILVDIGDDQSIVNSLSTFSSHMSNIACILKYATKDSLLIFDEFCSGTDIEQGQALAVAILEHLININSFVIISTHYNVLKYFAYTHEFVINASMQMDLEKMKPSYNLIFSVPGDSFAFSVASKSSIASDIVLRAKDIYASNKTEVNEILERLAEKEREIYLLEEELKDKHSLVALKEIEINNIRDNLILKERDLEEGFVNEQKEFLKASRKTLENLVREIKEGSVCTIKNKEFISNIENNIVSKITKIGLLNQQILTQVEFKVGDKVRVSGSNSSGEIIGVTKKGFIVNTGVFNITVSSSNLERILDNKHSRNDSKKNFSFSFESQDDDVFSLTVDIRGMRVAEAIDFLNRKIDNMLLRNVYKFEIIHGKGEGLLMEGVHAFLRGAKFIKKYYFAHPSDGGVGKTIVEF
ncbi:DNA mismatch repair protein mutS [Borrelia coriaceae ATCC 43381]|uniref:Endonuclease MutS2 n=2 Tax=Borrelia coriaceae TaxID=144 RepID=W5SU84_9SPIR|nr:DNA mismatch repair protein mutS [Borrelia coriaceae ATCC 43381]